MSDYARQRHELVTAIARMIDHRRAADPRALTTDVIAPDLVTLITSLGWRPRLEPPLPVGSQRRADPNTAAAAIEQMRAALRARQEHTP